MKSRVVTAVRTTLVLLLFTGFLYPLAVTLGARVLFPRQAGGSLVERDGRVVGSERIGQAFRAPGYLHSRPSAAGDGYDGRASGGTNLGPSSARLLEGAPDGSFEGVRRMAERVRAENGLPPGAPVPVDAVTRSASGLDPHVSVAYARLQIPRIARVRGLGEQEVERIVEEATEGRTWGILGEPRVDVLHANLALDRRAPGRSGARP